MNFVIDTTGLTDFDYQHLLKVLNKHQLFHTGFLDRKDGGHYLLINPLGKTIRQIREHLTGITVYTPKPEHTLWMVEISTLVLESLNKTKGKEMSTLTLNGKKYQKGAIYYCKSCNKPHDRFFVLEDINPDILAPFKDVDVFVDQHLRSHKIDSVEVVSKFEKVEKDACSS